LDDPLRLFAEEEVFAFVFAGWGAIGVLISASAASFV
jgi:hypothetical protein